MEREELSREENFFKKSFSVERKTVFKKGFSVKENREMEFLCYRRGSGIKRHF